MKFEMRETKATDGSALFDVIVNPYELRELIDSGLVYAACDEAEAAGLIDSLNTVLAFYRSNPTHKQQAAFATGVGNALVKSAMTDVDE